MGLRGRQALVCSEVSWGFPESNIPGKESFCRRANVPQGFKRTVDGQNYREWDDISVCELHGRSGAEDVNQKEYGRPEKPAKDAVRLGVGGVGLGLDLVSGRFAHEGSVRLTVEV